MTRVTHDQLREIARELTLLNRRADAANRVLLAILADVERQFAAEDAANDKALLEARSAECLVTLLPDTE